DEVDHGLHHGLAMLLVGFAVGGDHALVDAPGRLDLDGLRGREQGFETGLLLLGEQRGAAVEGAPRGIKRVALAAAVPAGDCWTRRRHWSRPSPARRTAGNGAI